MHSNVQAAPTRTRWLAAALVGLVLWLIGTIASQAIPQVLLGLELKGAAFAIVAAIQLVLGPLAVFLALRLVGKRLTDVGLVATQWKVDAVIGLAIAVAFALLQFLLIIPATGGAERADVVANLTQLGDAPSGVLAFIVLAWAGALSEELFFRGLLLTTLRGLFGGGRGATIAASAGVITLFAALHGYQGWAGVIDTGLYGGLTLTALYFLRGCRLTACIVAHAGWNSIASMVLWAYY